MSNEVQAAQQELIEEFAFFDDWMDRYQYLIDMGRRLPELSASEKIEANQIKGCQSQVWFVADKRDGRLEFRAAIPLLNPTESDDPGQERGISRIPAHHSGSSRDSFPDAALQRFGSTAGCHA